MNDCSFNCDLTNKLHNSTNETSQKKPTLTHNLSAHSFPRNQQNSVNNNDVTISINNSANTPTNINVNKQLN